MTVKFVTQEHYSIHWKGKLIEMEEKYFDSHEHGYLVSSLV